MAGRLVWGVKQSFRAYVRMTGGTMTVANGAELTPDDEAAFPMAPGGTLALDAGGRLSGTGAYRGEVHFEAHGGMLRVRLADPAVETGPDGAVLTVADPNGGGRRVEIARLDLAGATQSEDGAVVLPASVTMDGSFVLGDHYPPGTGLDAVRVWVG